MITASTFYGRLRSYERFIHFKKIQQSCLLPSSETIITMESMFKSLNLLIHIVEVVR